MYLKQNCNTSNNLVLSAEETFLSDLLPIFRVSEVKSSSQRIPNHTGTNLINFDQFDDGLPTRTPILNLIDLGLDFGMRKLFSSNKFHTMCKVVPISVVSPDILEPLYCKGLFTTLAIINNPIKRFLKSLIIQKVVSSITFYQKKFWTRLLDRNSRSGLIGVGLTSGLRTIS